MLWTFIPAINKMKPKIFQPFFTSKPNRTGNGIKTKLEYDMIKARRWEIKVVIKEG